MGDDESDVEEDEIYGFGSSPDSWDSNRSPFSKVNDPNSISDQDHHACFLMSSEDEEDRSTEGHIKSTKTFNEVIFFVIFKIFTAV